MVTFNNVLEKAYESIMLWEGKNCLQEVTVIRDVLGRISFLMKNIEYPQEHQVEQLKELLQHNLNHFFSQKIYWKKLSGANHKNIEGRMQPVFQMVEDERVEWSLEGEIKFYLSERPIAKKAWVKSGEVQDAVWSYEDAVAENGTKVVTFYSFKGGMGRTTALAGVALILVQQGYNVMMVDTDIEAPGLATLFFDEESIRCGVLDYLIEHPLAIGRNINEYVLDVTDAALLEEEDGNLYLMPAGKVDEHYLQKLARIDYQDNRENYLKDSLFSMLNDLKVHYEVDYILIDARAGFHDMGGVAVSQLPHGAVLFGNSSRQSWDGMTQVLKTIAEGHPEDWPVLIVDSMCEKPTSSGYAAMKLEFIQKAYEVCIENYYNTGEAVPGLEAEGVAHAPEFVSFDDALLQGIELFSSGSEDQDERVHAYKELLTGNSYMKIAERIKSWFGEEE